MQRLFDDINLQPCTTKTEQREYRLNELFMEFCYKHKVSTWKMKSPSRENGLVRLRVKFTKSVACEFTQMEIGSILDRDHTSIGHYLNKFTQ